MAVDVQEISLPHLPKEQQLPLLLPILTFRVVVVQPELLILPLRVVMDPLLTCGQMAVLQKI